MRVPLSAPVHSKTEGMVLWQSKIIGDRRIHEDEGTGRICIPYVRRNHIGCSVQLVFD